MLDFTDNIHLDQLDMRLLHLLMEDSKTPYAELARQLNLSRAAVTKRVNALVEKGVIERFTVYINPKKIRLDITILFELITTPAYVQAIMDELRQHTEIGEVYMTSAATVFAHGYFADSLQLNDFLFRVLSKMQGLNEVKTHMILATKYKRDLIENLISSNGLVEEGK